MKYSNDVCGSTLTNLKTLLDLIKAVQRQNNNRAQPEVKNAIEQISEKFTELEKKCFKRIGKNDVVKFIRPKKNELLLVQ